MAQNVHQLLSRLKSKPPKVEFQLSEPGSSSSTATCTVTLETLASDLGGYPEMRFKADASSKKQAKSLAMQKAWAFLQGTSVYTALPTKHGNVRPNLPLGSIFSLCFA